MEKILAPDIFTDEFFHTLKEETRPILHQKREQGKLWNILLFIL